MREIEMINEAVKMWKDDVIDYQELFSMIASNELTQADIIILLRSQSRFFTFYKLINGAIIDYNYMYEVF